MTLVYATKKTKIDGRHIKPSDFSGKPARGAKVVYTDDKRVKDAYEAVGIEVKPIKERKDGSSKS